MKNIKHLKILYLEDDLKLQQTMAKQLSYFIDNIICVSDGVSALTSYHQNKPDILLLDINVPTMNGLEVLRQIREFDLNTKAIILTAYSDMDTLLSSSQLHLVKFLNKPVILEDLLKAFQEAANELENYQIISKKKLTIQGEYEWDFENNILLFNQTPIKLTEMESKIFAILVTHIATPICYDDFIYSLWDDYESNKINILKTLIKTLRKKLPTELIKNIYGFGYKIDL